MGTLIFFLIPPKVDLCAKFLIYQDIPINWLLCGYESLVLTKVITDKLEVFHIRFIRMILGKK